MDNLRGPRALLGNKDLRLEYGIGRDLATRLAERLPHVRAGTVGRGVRRLVHRADMERLLKRAKDEGADLWELVRAHDAASLKSWLDSGPPVAA